jgi:hypothetical protein
MHTIQRIFPLNAHAVCAESEQDLACAFKVKIMRARVAQKRNEIG